MNGDLANRETNVADLLRQTPEAARIFIKWQTACVGCYLAKFCALQDVVKAYRFDEETFLRELVKFTAPKS